MPACAHHQQARRGSNQYVNRVVCLDCDGLLYMNHRADDPSLISLRSRTGQAIPIHFTYDNHEECASAAATLTTTGVTHPKNYIGMPPPPHVRYLTTPLPTPNMTTNSSAAAETNGITTTSRLKAPDIIYADKIVHVPEVSTVGNIVQAPEVIYV